MNKSKFYALQQKQLQARTLDDQFQTTYGSSYVTVPTYDASPVYDDHREMKKVTDPNFQPPYNDNDLSPYPSRTWDPTSLGRYQPFDKPYINSNRSIRRQEHGYEEPEPERKFRYNPEPPSSYREPQTNRSRYDDDPAPNRTRYQPDPSPRRNDGQEQQRNIDYRDYDDEENAPQRLEAEFRDQLVNADDAELGGLKLIGCNQCFKSKVCMNKMVCMHQFCDPCTARLDGSDNPDGQKSFEWNFKCNICSRFTPGRRVVRLDPFGRRLMKQHKEQLYENP